MRPAPREPSKQLKANSLPATKRRAASAVMVSACTLLDASTAASTIASHATMKENPPLPIPSPRGRQAFINHPNQADLVATWSTNSQRPSPIFTRSSPDLHHDSTANAPINDGRRG